MSLLEELAVETSRHTEVKVNEVLVSVEKDVQIIEQKIVDVKTETLDKIDLKFENAVEEFVTLIKYAKDLADLNNKIDSNYGTLDEKKIDKIESTENLKKVRQELLTVTDELDDRKIDKILAQKLIDDLNAALIDVINTLRISLQDQLDTLKLTKADKDTVQIELTDIKELISKEGSRATDAENTLTDNLNTEIQRAKNQENILNTNIKNETSRAIEAELNITNNLNAEISRAKTKEQNLQDQITENDNCIHSDLNDEISRAKAVEADLQDQIDENNNTLTFNLKQEEQARIAGDIALENDLRIQTERIDNMLALSTTDKDSFKEIVDFIEAVDLENDNAFAGYVVSNNKVIQELDNKIDNEIIRAGTSEDVIQNQLNIETTRASKREKEIALDLEDETVRAKTSEEALDNKIEDETNRALESERYLQEQIDDCDSKHKSNYLKLDDKIDNEIIRATDAENTIQNEINIEVVRASKSEKEIAENLDNEIQRAKSEELKLSDNLDNEIDRAKIKEDYLNSLISQENIRATKEENYINSRLDNEISRAKSVEADLQEQIDELEEDCVKKSDILDTKIDNEILTARTNENSLKTDIINENARAEKSESELNTKIENETSRAILEEQRLQTTIDEKYRVYDATVDKINSLLSIESSRIDSILTASTTDTETFAEIVNLVNSIDLESDDRLPAIIAEINNKIKAVDEKVILETARASKEEIAIKNENNEKVLEISESVSTIDTKVENETTRSKTVEQLLENTLNDHTVKLEKFETDLKNLDIKFENNLNSLDKDLNDKVTEIQNNLEVNENTFKTLFNDEVKNINEAEAKIKADYEYKFTETDKKQIDLETRLASTETKLNTTEEVLNNNTGVLLEKINTTESKTLETDEKLNELNEKINILENIDLDSKIEKSETVAELKNSLTLLNNDFSQINDKITYYDRFLNDDSDDNEGMTEEELEQFNQALLDIENINKELDEINSSLNSLSSKMEDIQIPEAYDDTEVHSLIAKEEERAINKESELENKIVIVKNQIEDIINGSTMDLDSFAKVINYINSIDIENKDIGDLITANESRLSNLETKTEELNQVLSDLISIKETLVSTEEANSKLKSELELTNKTIEELKISSDTNNNIVNEEITKLITDTAALEIKLNDLTSEALKNLDIVNYDDTELIAKIKNEEKRAVDAENLLANKIDNEIKRSASKEAELENNINDVLEGRKIVSKSLDTNTLNGKEITDLVLKSEYVGLAEDGKALNVSGNILTLTNSNGFIESVELPSTSSETVSILPEPRTELNSLRSSQYLMVSVTDWQVMKTITLDAGVYNFNISTENYIDNIKANYTDIDEFIGQALVLPQGDFDSYGSLTPSTYLDDTYKSKDTNMFNLMDCTQGNYNNASGQIVLKERQEVRIMLRSLVYSEVTFLLKAQLYKIH